MDATQCILPDIIANETLSMLTLTSITMWHFHSFMKGISDPAPRTKLIQTSHCHLKARRVSACHFRLFVWAIASLHFTQALLFYGVVLFPFATRSLKMSWKCLEEARFRLDSPLSLSLSLSVCLSFYLAWSVLSQRCRGCERSGCLRATCFKKTNVTPMLARNSLGMGEKD